MNTILQNLLPDFAISFGLLSISQLTDEQKLLAIRYHHTKDKSVAEEILQEVFISLPK